MTKALIVHNALVETYWSSKANPGDMAKAVIRATHSDDISDDTFHKIISTIDRRLISSAPTSFPAMVNEVMELLRKE